MRYFLLSQGPEIKKEGVLLLTCGWLPLDKDSLVKKSDDQLFDLFYRQKVLGCRSAKND